MEASLAHSQFIMDCNRKVKPQERGITETYYVTGQDIVTDPGAGAQRQIRRSPSYHPRHEWLPPLWRDREPEPTLRLFAPFPADEIATPSRNFRLEKISRPDPRSMQNRRPRFTGRQVMSRARSATPRVRLSLPPLSYTHALCAIMTGCSLGMQWVIFCAHWCEGNI